MPFAICVPEDECKVGQSVTSLQMTAVDEAEQVAAAAADDDDVCSV